VTTTYRVYVWGMAMKGGNRVIERRNFKTEGGARRFAERRSTETGKATITTPGPDDPIGHPLAYYREGRSFDPDQTTTTITTEDTTMSKDTAKKPAAKKQAATPAAKPKAKAAPIKTWADVLTATDGQVAKAFSDRRAKPLVIDADKILKAAKSTKGTARYDSAYLRFLAGHTGSVPSNPTSTGIESGEARTKRRAAIRKALATITASKKAA
jgi:hypothetical protein